MVYKLTVTDSGGALVPSVSIKFVDAKGNTLLTDSVPATGVYSIDSDTDNGLLVDGITCVVSSPGYYDTSFPSSSIMSYQATAELQAKANTTKFLIAGTIIGLIFFALMKRTDYQYRRKRKK